MGNVLLNQFREKLAKKNSKDSGLGTSSIKIDFNDFTNKRNQAFVSCSRFGLEIQLIATLLSLL